ncbi:retroviral-like aspartic protease family protein [Gynurincola endophyticus]|uniref:retroviral-like aspartic protease family protein n=1 Tax=Gynurincola endophyticus TaxID=2479004 RepID=UPI000F8D697F|nr:retroviral-like aspartic protease family protein [Gynurincola endophyticus]
MKNNKYTFKHTTYSLPLIFLLILIPFFLAAQKKVPVIKSSIDNVVIKDGKNIRLNWRLEPSANPDIYYINIPRKKGITTLKTDQGEINFNSKYGKSFNFIVLLNEKDSCHIQFKAADEPTAIKANTEQEYPVSIPFEIIGSRIYLQGKLNNERSVKIQFDLGAGTTCINKAIASQSGLTFNSQTLVNNTQGTNLSKTSTGNQLTIGALSWQEVPFTEVSNMQSHEDLIIGNSLFRDKVIEIDYDLQLLTVHERLPKKAKRFATQPVLFEQHRPKLEVYFQHEEKLYSHWFLFDTGREGTMLIGEDFTQQKKYWKELEELQLINGKKIIRLDAIVGGVKINDIVTNAADPSKPGGRGSLLGNQVLSKFNVILDNLNGAIYLSPNKRTNTPYSDYAAYLKEFSK